jgi:hypothetical protein
MRSFYCFAALICLMPSANSQIIPLELMAGQRNGYQQFSVTKASGLDKVQFFNTSSLLYLYDAGSKSELMSQSYLTYSLTRSLKPGIGSFYASVPGLKPSVNLQIFKEWRQFKMLFVPRIDLRANPSIDLMSMLEYRVIIAQKWMIVSRIQTMFSYTGTTHNRSYQYLRFGVQSRNTQFGIALNLDAYGIDYNHFNNYGFFFKINLK